MESEYINGNNNHKVEVQEEWWEVDFINRHTEEQETEILGTEQGFELLVELLGSLAINKRHAIKALNRVYYCSL